MITAISIVSNGKRGLRGRGGEIWALTGMEERKECSTPRECSEERHWSWNLDNGFGLKMFCRWFLVSTGK